MFYKNMHDNSVVFEVIKLIHKLLKIKAEISPTEDIREQVIISKLKIIKLVSESNAELLSINRLLNYIKDIKTEDSMILTTNSIFKILSEIS